MNAISLERAEQLEEILKSKAPVILFKHNTSCPISMRAKLNLENGAEKIPNGIDFYIVDLLSHRDISNSVAEQFNVEHESPQLLVIKDGNCCYSSSHSDISAEDTAKAIKQLG